MLIPCDFIAPAQSHNPLGWSSQQIVIKLLCTDWKHFAFGKTKEEVEAEFGKAGKSLEEVKDIVPFKVFTGNKPTNSILVQKITPFVLGALIAMYEHKIFTQGVIFNIFSFDQWGVELGKQLANRILPELAEKRTFQAMIAQPMDWLTNSKRGVKIM